MANFHAKVTYIEGAGFYLSKNNVGSQIWQRISEEGKFSHQQPVKPGDHLKIGTSVFRVEHNGYKIPKSMTSKFIGGAIDQST